MGSRPTSTLGAERGAVVSPPGRCPGKRAAENVARGGPKEELQPGSVVVGGRAVPQRSDDALRRVRAAIREKRERQTMKHHESRPLIPHCPLLICFPLDISQGEQRRDMRRGDRKRFTKFAKFLAWIPETDTQTETVLRLCLSASRPLFGIPRGCTPCTNTCNNNQPPGRCCLLENKEAVEEEAAGL